MTTEKNMDGDMPVYHTRVVDMSHKVWGLGRVVLVEEIGAEEPLNSTSYFTNLPTGGGLLILSLALKPQTAWAWRLLYNLTIKYQTPHIKEEKTTGLCIHDIVVVSKSGIVLGRYFCHLWAAEAVKKNFSHTKKTWKLWATRHID